MFSMLFSAEPPSTGLYPHWASNTAERLTAVSLGTVAAFTDRGEQQSQAYP